MRKNRLKNNIIILGMILYTACATCVPVMNVSAGSVGAVANEQLGTDENTNNDEHINMNTDTNSDEDINNDEVQNHSSDADLKSLKLSPGELSPGFSSAAAEYTFELTDDMRQVIVEAKTSDKNAKIVSMSGFSNISIGENKAVINVKAPNGNVKSYRILVKKEAGENNASDSIVTATPDAEGNFIVDDLNLKINGKFPDELLPDGCTKVEYVYKNNYIEGALFEEGELMLLYLTDSTGGNGAFYIYYSGTDEFLNFVQIKGADGQFVFPVQYPTGIPVPSGFKDTIIELDGNIINAYTVSEADTDTEYVEFEEEQEEPAYIIPSSEEYFLFFGISNRGNKGWYLYDTAEKSCQRFLELSNSSDANVGAFDEDNYVKYKQESQRRMVIICVLVFVVAVCLAVILNLLLKSKDDDSNDDDSDDGDSNDDDSDDGDSDDDDSNDGSEKDNSAFNKKESFREKRKRLQKEKGNDDLKKSEDTKSKDTKSKDTKSKDTKSKDTKSEDTKSEHIKPNITKPEREKLVRKAPILNGDNEELTESPQDILDDDFEFEFIDIRRK